MEPVDYTLGELRRRRGMTQRDIAEALSRSQARVWKIERLGPMRLEVETLARYVEALGGRLRLFVDLSDYQMEISTGRYVNGTEADVSDHSGTTPCS